MFVVKETVRVKAECVLGRELTAAAATAAECPERQRERDDVFQELIQLQTWCSLSVISVSLLSLHRCAARQHILAVPGQ